MEENGLKVNEWNHECVVDVELFLLQFLAFIQDLECFQLQREWTVLSMK